MESKHATSLLEEACWYKCHASWNDTTPHPGENKTTNPDGQAMNALAIKDLVLFGSPVNAWCGQTQKRREAERGMT